MNAHEFIDYELEFDLSNPYIPIEEESIGMLDERDDAIENEVDNVKDWRCGGKWSRIQGCWKCISNLEKKFGMHKNLIKLL